MFAAQSPTPDDGVALAAWSTGFRDALRPYALPGGYANFLMDEGLDAARGCYGSSAGRLAVLKGRYDPANVFRRNQNILPTIGAASTASVHGGPDPRLRANRLSLGIPRLRQRTENRAFRKVAPLMRGALRTSPQGAEGQQSGAF